MLAIDVGDNAANQLDVFTVSVQPGATVTVKNVAGSTLNYYTSLNGSATTLAVSASQSFTLGPVWCTAGTGRTSLQITGTGY